MSRGRRPMNKKGTSIRGKEKNKGKGDNERITERMSTEGKEEDDLSPVCLRFRGEARGGGGWCYTPQGVYPASLTPSTVSVCQDRKT